MLGSGLLLTAGCVTDKWGQQFEAHTTKPLQEHIVKRQAGAEGERENKVLHSICATGSSAIYLAAGRAILVCALHHEL